MVFINIHFDNEREQNFKNTTQTKAKVLKIDQANFSGHGASVSFEVNEENIKGHINCDCKMLEVGDSLLIEYSNDDNSLIRLVRNQYTDELDPRIIE